MIEGVLRHCTDLEIRRQYVDSHGQSEVAFAFCKLLGFELAPRLKAIARQKLCLPRPGMKGDLPNLMQVIKHPVTITTTAADESHWVVSAPAGRLRRGRVPHGLPQDRRPVLEEGIHARRRPLGRASPRG